jgi:hypothetical protein
MAKPPGKCVFCDKPGGMSKQHVWPNWLKPHNPATGTHHVQQMGVFHTFTPRSAVSPPKLVIREGPAGSRKVRRVCQTCNHGWIRQFIEEPAKPTTLALMRGDMSILTRSQQKTMATWLTLVAMMIELTDLTSFAIPAAHRRYLMDRKEPPPGWHVWLAKYGGARWEDHVARQVELQLSASPENEEIGAHKANTQVTTLVLGQLCAHVFSSTSIPDFSGYHGITLQTIWPARSYDVFWQFVETLSDAEVLYLSEALASGFPHFPARD